MLQRTKLSIRVPVDCKTFCFGLPENVFYVEKDGFMVNLAFVENNEIAYVCLTDNRFENFACNLVTLMFKKYSEIFFESDDCDWAATVLKNLLKNQNAESFDLIFTLFKL